MQLTSEIRIDKLHFFFIAIVGWFASGSLSFLELSKPEFDEVYGFPIVGEVSRIYSYLAFLFMMIALLSTRHLFQKAINYALESVPIRLIILSGVMEALFAAVMGLYISAVYAGLLLICVLVCSSFWCLPEKYRILFYKFLLVLNIVYASLALIMYGAPQNRFVGGIHPNIFSQASIAMTFAALMFLSGWRRTAVILASLFIAYIVDSRYALATALIMYFFLLLMDSTLKARLLSLLFSVALITMFFFTDIFSEVFSLDDANRGFSSGASGRFDNWENFLPQLGEHPFFGYGFRNHNFAGAHNGFMEYVLENGLIISFIFFLAVFLILISNISTVWHSRSDRTFQAHEGRVVLATLLGIIFAANLQPQLINFGDEFGPLTLMILMYVPAAYRSFEWPRTGKVRRHKLSYIRPAKAVSS